MRISRRFDPILLVFLLFLGLAAPLSADTFTIPGIVNTSGLNGTHFVSDVALTNPGAAAATVSFALVIDSSPDPKTLSLGAGQTIVYRDIVGGPFALSGVAGALAITSDQPLLLRARTYNNAGAGTYGVALPVFTDQTFLSSGDAADSLWVSQSPDPATGYRTNIAVMFPDETGGDATVTVFDGDGNSIGQQSYSRDTAGFQQIGVAAFAGAVPVGRAQILVTRGRAAGYTVVNDNVTGDSSLFTFEDLPAGIQDVLVNGVARASGRNGTFFRTDGRFYNPTDTAATVTVAFHAAGDSNPTPATATFTLAAGKIRDVVDVLSSLLGLPVGSSGALRFNSTWPVGILCRTSNVDPTGANPGTFGSQQKAVPLLSFLSSADAGAIVAGIRQNAAFRTNIGFAAGADGAVCSLTLKTAGGVTASTGSVSLGAFGWTQPSVQDLFPGVTIPDDATLQVKVTSGSVDVYDSSIDNTSGDSVLTPIAPLPSVIPSSATIGPAGGSIRSDDGRLTLRVPAGALGQPVAFSFQPGTSDAPLGVGPGYQLLPANAAFSKPALLTLAYSGGDVEGSGADSLSLAANDGSEWVGAGGGSVDTSLRTLTVPISSATPSPQTAAGARPRALAPAGYATWTFVTSWRMSPHGSFALLVGGQVSFMVESTGPSSSTSPPAWVLSRSPREVSVSWFVNRQNGGNMIDGTINLEGLLGVYQAGACPPPLFRNPVSIEAHISNSGPFSAPYEISTRARVLILPRKWDFSVNLSVTFACPYALVADHAVYDAGFSFSLADDLTIDTRTLHEPATTYDADPIPFGCAAGDVAFSHTGGDHLVFDITEGNFFFENILAPPSFDTTLSIGMPTLIGYNYVHKYQGGQQAMHQDALILQIPGVPFTLSQGKQLVPIPLPYTGFTAVWTFDLEPICP